jgi:ABC-2 type transport system permease protein
MNTSGLRTVGLLLRKEFLQIFRNRTMLPIIFIMPIVQLIVLASAATFEVREIRFGVVDDDRSSASAGLTDRFDAGGYFIRHAHYGSATLALEDMQRGRIRMILQIPGGFERDLHRDGSAGIGLMLDAQDGFTAGVMNAYAARIVAAFSAGVTVRPTAQELPAGPVPGLVPATWYNPDLGYRTYMIPGILVVLVTMIGTFLAAMNIVREKEIGTIDQLNVSPIRRSHFILGKLLPFWLIALVELAFGLLVAWIVFRIPIAGSLPLVFGVASIYLLVVLGIGLWISTVAETQQQAMFVAWFVMVIFILMSGLFTPVSSMPDWAQTLTFFNPVAHFIEIMRRVLIKGAGFADIKMQVWTLSAFAVVVLTTAVARYRKTA